MEILNMWDLKKHYENTAVISEDGNRYSYKKLETETNKIADIIGGRCLIFCLCRNETGALVGYVACLNHRIVPLMLADGIEDLLLESLISQYKPAYIWMPESNRNKFFYKEVYSAFHYVLLKTEFENCVSMHEELSLLLTTSGSTGSPKLVRLSYDNVKANMQSIAEYLELSATERAITTLPMNYTYGLSIINSHLFSGAAVIMTEKTLMQKEFWNQFLEYEATSFGGVPYTYEMLDRLNFYEMDLPSLRAMTQAGGKLSVELHKKFAEFARQHHIHFYIMYGQTEATARMSYLPYQYASEKSGSMGIAIPGGKFSLLDASGEEILGPNVIGELVYEGPNVMLGYAECAVDLEKGDECRRRLITGDMAKRDADGFYYIVGRKKRFLKIFGNRVNLDEAERLIKSRYPELDCACTGIDDSMTIFITNHTLLADVKKYITEITKLNNAAFSVRFIQSLPKNDAGKTLYGELVDI